MQKEQVIIDFKKNFWKSVLIGLAVSIFIYKIYNSITVMILIFSMVFTASIITSSLVELTYYLLNKYKE